MRMRVARKVWANLECGGGCKYGWRTHNAMQAKLRWICTGTCPKNPVRYRGTVCRRCWRRLPQVLGLPRTTPPPTRLPW